MSVYSPNGPNCGVTAPKKRNPAQNLSQRPNHPKKALHRGNNKRAENCLLYQKEKIYEFIKDEEILLHVQYSIVYIVLSCINIRLSLL